MIRAEPGDFQVDEVLGFEPPGEGDHRWFHLRYANENTMDVARAIARACGVPLRDIGFSGLKDRNALTAQWFSVPVSRQREDPKVPIVRLCDEHANMALLTASANARKLKRGVHRANRFQIRIRQLQADPDQLRQRLHSIREGGVPNYFGPQRFGRNGSNLDTAMALFTGKGVSRGRQSRSMALSAARSWLFNHVLSERLGRWALGEAVAGDRMMLAGSRSHFLNDGRDDTVVDRIRQGDIHPSGPLWGAGEPLVTGMAAQFEHEVIHTVPIFPDGLTAAGLKQERRALRVLPESMTWCADDPNSLEVSFTLPAGSFATAVLRELIEFE